VTHIRNDLIEKVGKQIAWQVQEQLVHLFHVKSRRVIVIAGPTGVGKTAISLKLAELLGGEIVSADSMHIYRGMDIGTAKVSTEDRSRIPHHMVDVRDISEPFHVFDFYNEAMSAIDDILRRGKVAIVVGGTGFYIHSILYGPPSGPPSDEIIRQRLEYDAEQVGLEFLFDRLRAVDPEYAETITPCDHHKIIRALEIITISGRRVSDFSWKDRPPLPAYDFRCWFLHLSRPLLYQRVEARCREMLDAGLLQEVLSLDKKGLRKNRTASRAIGYHQVLTFLDTAQGPQDYQEFVESFLKASRHLVKRQYTWFRREPLFRWVDTKLLSTEQLLELFVDDYHSAVPIVPPEVGEGEYPCSPFQEE